MKIAIVEDDINMRKSLEIALSDYDEFKVTSYKSATEALKKLKDDIDVIVTDINMPGLDGISFIKELNGKFDVIVITGNATLNRAIESVRLGVKDFLTKPFDIETLVEAIKRNAIIKEKIQKAPKIKQNQGKESFLGHSVALEKALKIAKKAAITDASVMLLGESGVGKELFAKTVHSNSQRKNNNFIAINMAAIPDNLIESELFGYEKGAFTDASAMKKGQFELASGGTLFLDEIAEMPQDAQAKLLRVLQEREILRVGGTKTIPIDVRIVCATNANMIEKISNGNFREDLYYRLNTIPIEIPPLRERKTEIKDISEAVLKQNCVKYSLPNKTLSKEALEALEEYNWPGNIRELISVIERAAILSESDEIAPDDLFLESRKVKKSINEMEAQLIDEVLTSVDKNLSKASQILGINEENLKEKVKKYNL